MAKPGPGQGNSVGKLLLSLVGIFALASVACFYIASKYYSETYLSTAASARQKGDAFDLITFTEDGAMVGASVKSGRMKLERWSGDPDSTETDRATVDLDGALPVQWVISQNGKQVAWLADSRIFTQKVPFDGEKVWSEAASIEAPSGLRSFGIMPGGTIGIALSKGEILQMDPKTGKVLAQESVGSKLTWAQFRGDYTAVATRRKLFLYRFLNGTFKRIEERDPMDNTLELRLPADGQMLAITKAGIRNNEGTRNAPGRVADVQMTDQGFFVATGDFPGVWELPLKRDAALIAEGPAGAQLAASRRALAFTSKQGTVLLAMHENARLTDTGRMIAAMAVVFALLAIIMLIIYFFAMKPGDDARIKTRKGKEEEEHLPKPPPELVQAISSGEATLWAGAGLSAPSGLSLRPSFISKVFETASNEEWCKYSFIEQYWKLIANGKAEEALDRFVHSDPVIRVRVNDLIRATYSRFAASNETHRQLAKLPFTTAITTNYDTLLERAGAPWAINVTGINTPVNVLELGSHLIVKLWGDFEEVKPPILCRKDFEQMIADTPEFVRAFQQLYESRPILFIGASIDGLLADLAALKAPKTEIKHYAVTGVGSSNWKPGAKQLKSRYNIEVIPAGVTNLQDELKTFLANLVVEVEKERSRVSPAAMSVIE